MEGSLLAVDIGNTQTVLGVFVGGKLASGWRFSTYSEMTSDELAFYFEGFLKLKGFSISEIRGIIVSSVVPRLTTSIIEFAENYISEKPLIIGMNTRAPIKIKTEKPKEVGSDRLVNAVAAFDRYGGPLVVVDFGTATTFDAISAEGSYLGGAIAPGIEISTKALFSRASRLARVEISMPPGPIGKNTDQSLQSGIVFGFAGQVDRIVSMMKEELGSETRTIATGGLASVVVDSCENIDIFDQDLTLFGLKIIYEESMK